MYDAKMVSLSKIEVGQTILTTDVPGLRGFARPKDPDAVPLAVTAKEFTPDQWSGKVWTLTLSDGTQTEGRYGTTHVYVTKAEPVTHVEVDGVKVAEVRHDTVAEPVDVYEPVVEPQEPAGVGSVKSTDLVAALTAVLPFAADPKDALPLLASVHFETRDDQLVLVTTDRYSMGTYSIPWEGGEVNASVEKPKDLLAWAKKVDKLYPITLTFEEREVEASTYDGKATFRLYDGEFPRWEKLMPTPEQHDARFGINPNIAARFTKAGEKGDPMVVSFGSPIKPFRVEVGERFVGLIMPVRLPDASPAPVAERINGTPVSPQPVPAPREPEPEPEVDTVDGSMAAAAAGESGRRVTRDADGTVRIADWTGGEQDVVTGAGKHVHIDADGVVTENLYDTDDDEPVAVTPITAVERPVVTTDRCSVCKGYGVVRKYGDFKGTHYKTAKGAAEATAKGNSMPCTSIAHGAKVAA